MDKLYAFYNSMDLKVFGTEIRMITFVIIILQLFVSLFALITMLTRPKDMSRKRFFVLTLYFLVYNVFGGLFPNDSYEIPRLIQLILAYLSGICLPVYFFYYLTKELDINLGFLFNHRVLLFVLILLFISTYLVTYLVTGDPNSARQIFIIIPLMIGLLFCVKTVIFVLSHFKVKYAEEHFRYMANAGNFSIIFMVGLPVVTAFGDFQVIEVLLVNTSFIIISLAFIKRYIYLGRIEADIMIRLEQKKEIIVEEIQDTVIPEFNILDMLAVLTGREQEIVQLLADEEMKYSDIAKVLFIAQGTVSKHASNIYRKFNVKNRKEFIQKFNQSL